MLLKEGGSPLQSSQETLPVEAEAFHLVSPAFQALSSE